ncbi:MAG TPA: hypothetical protein VN729_06360 [Ktedonobacteraceae bacterium]|nr:hypothetical protein [Ktedonobacteraceae bacterium]
MTEKGDVVIIMKHGQEKVKLLGNGSIFHFVAGVVQCKARTGKIGSTREE